MTIQKAIENLKRIRDERCWAESYEALTMAIEMMELATVEKEEKK